MDIVSELRHRHVIALPLFLAVVGVIAVMGQGTLPAQVDSLSYQRVDSTKNDQTVTLPNSTTRVIVFKNSFFDIWNGRPVLHNGSILAGAKGLSEIYSDRAIIRGIDGAFFANMKDNVLTVAAITTPVSVRIGQQSLAIPIGYQWTAPKSDLPSRDDGWTHWLEARKPSALTRKFVRDMTEKWQALPPLSAPVATKKSGWLQLFPWQFAAAKQRADNREKISVLSAVSTFAENNDATELHTLLSDDSLRASLLETPESISTLSALVGSSQPAVIADVLPLLNADPEIALLASLHPELRSAAWAGLPTADARDPRDILRLTMLPLSDTGEEPLSPVLLSAWQSEVENVLVQLKDERGSFLGALLPSLAGTSRMFALQGYPERSAHYREIAEELGDAYRSDLDPSTAVLIDLLKKDDLTASLTEASAPTATPVVTEASKVAPVPLTSAEVDRVRNDVRARLIKAGAVISLAMEIRPQTTTTAIVTGAIFPSKDGDRSFSFLFDLAGNQVSNVSVGGKAMPYGMSFDGFTAWAEGRE